MKLSEITNSIGTLPKIGPAKSALFAKVNIFTVADLLQNYPRAYDDRTRRTTLAECMAAGRPTAAHTIAQVTGHEWFGYGRMRHLKIIITDGTAAGGLVAFNRPWLENSLRPGAIVAVHGEFSFRYGSLQCSAFETEKLAEAGNLAKFFGAAIPNSRVLPIYRQTEGLTSRIISQTVESALAQFAKGIEDDLPEEVTEARGLLHKRDALRKIHLPSSLSEAEEARRTLAFEELFVFQRTLAERALAHRGRLPALEPADGAAAEQERVPDGEFLASLSPSQKRLLERLPFQPTDDQKSVVALMNRDIDRNYDAAARGERPYAMRALLQGDVGSGKTLVSFFAALRVIDYGGQCALMAPTELLARQHAENAARLLEAVGVRAAYLTGNIKSKGRTALLAALKSGDVNLVIGTHALFSKSVVYRDLALAIIDEQHRFGVMQRSAILQKGRTSESATLREPNLLMMSATPIPQTLALTVFGDLDVLTLRTMPNGRKPVKTFLVKAGNEPRAYEAVRGELRAGRQAYFVYPAIEAGDEEEGTEGAKSAEEMFAFLSQQVYPEFSVALVHGKVDEDETARILGEFREGRVRVLVATTVVEVGVDVPNATCIVIEQADRFGLAALHQLRGRVGRGSEQSYCFLVYRASITENGIERMKAIHGTTDGFKIAEEDLRLRGPGEITGTAQSGELTFKIADPAADPEAMMAARKDAFDAVARSAEKPTE